MNSPKPRFSTSIGLLGDGGSDVFVGSGIRGKRAPIRFGAMSDAARATLDDWECLIRDLDFEYYVLVDKDGNVIGNGTDFKEDSISQIVFRSRPSDPIRHNWTYTHNHPNGQSISPTDIKTAIETGFGVIRAVGAQYRHTMEIPPNLPKGFYQNVIDPLLDSHVPQIQAEQQRAIAQGRMTEEEAVLLGFHTVWERVCHDLGREYHREEWT